MDMAGDHTEVDTKTRSRYRMNNNLSMAVQFVFKQEKPKNQT